MKALKTFCAIILTAVIGMHGNAQAVSGHIDSLRMTPANPTTDDTIRIIFYDVFPSSGCTLNARIYYENLPFITNTSQYCLGNMTMMCYVRDTVILLPLPAGAYILHYRLESGYFSAGCVTYDPADSADVQFTVTHPISTGGRLNGEGLFTLVNDPVSGRLFIILKCDCRNCTVSVQNALGEEVYRNRLKDQQNEITCNWPEGMYLVTVFDGKRTQTRKVLIMSSH